MASVNKRVLKILVLILTAGCILCTAPFYIDSLLAATRNFLAPKSKLADIPGSRLLYKFPDGIYRLSWSKDGSIIRVNKSNWTSSTPHAPDTIIDYYLVTDKIIYQDAISYDNNNADFIGTNTLFVDEESEDEEFWVFCDIKPISVAAGGFEGEQYWVRYWENHELANTFYFSSKQWPVDYLTPYVSLGFSPSCDKVSITLSGWIYYEGEGKEELWVLDLSTQTFGRNILGEKPLFALWDYPVQDVTPSWSPDEKHFVFGSGQFGLEIFDITGEKRKLLAGPQYNLYFAQWSPSGHWIAAIQLGMDSKKLYVFSPDGLLHSYSDECDSIVDFWWAPKEDKIAYICEKNIDTCKITDNCADENSCQQKDYLLLWDLEKK